MKILHVFRHPPDEVVRELAAIISREREATEFALYQDALDYDLLLELVLSNDQVISWW
ncbi:MAG: hypothetical protein ACLPT6_06710 [Desulfobaccales bacterium]